MNINNISNNNMVSLEGSNPPVKPVKKEDKSNILILMLLLQAKIMDSLNNGLEPLSMDSTQYYNEIEKELTFLKDLQKYSNIIPDLQTYLSNTQIHDLFKLMREGKNTYSDLKHLSTFGVPKDVIKKLVGLTPPKDLKAKNFQQQLNSTQSSIETLKQNLSQLWQTQILTLYDEVNTLNNMGGNLISDIVASNKVKI